MTPTGAEMVASFDALFGGNTGLRAVHAKGTCCEATFTATSNASRLTTAAHMQGTPVRAIVRFSNGSGDPSAHDAGREPRGMAVKFFHAGGHTTDIVSINHPLFIVRTPEEFLEFMRLRVPDPETGQIDMAALAAFVGARPESMRAAQILLTSPPLDSFLTTEYFGIHAFRFISPDGTSRFGRYRWSPAAGVSTITPEEAEARPANYLREDLRARLERDPATFTLRITLASAQDDPSDPTTEWPAGREEIVAGELTITGAVADQLSDCEQLRFDPTRLCDGIETSEDKILNARPPAYTFSSERRARP